MEREFDLTEKERLSYILQLLILEKLEPEDNVYANIRKALENGFTNHYADLKDTFLANELSLENCRLVLDILDMYRGLIFSAQNHKWDNMQKVRFPGFDCNDTLESKMYSYAKYFMEDLDRFDEIKQLSNHEYNSHREMLPKYKRMLEIWNSLSMDNQYRMTERQMQEILEA